MSNLKEKELDRLVSKFIIYMFRRWFLSGALTTVKNTGNEILLEFKQEAQTLEDHKTRAEFTKEAALMHGLNCTIRDDIICNSFVLSIKRTEEETKMIAGAQPEVVRIGKKFFNREIEE